jgi:hypothetical protein
MVLSVRSVSVNFPPQIPAQPNQTLRKTKTLKTTRKGAEETFVKVPIPDGAEGGFPEKSKVTPLSLSLAFIPLLLGVDLIDCGIILVFWYVYVIVPIHFD